MAREKAKKVLTDNDVKKKAVKLVITHLKKKIADVDFSGKEYVDTWIGEMEEIVNEAEFNVVKCFEMRKELNDVIERTPDEEMRFKMRDSWYSLGRALDKKAKNR